MLSEHLVRAVGNRLYLAFGQGRRQNYWFMIVGVGVELYAFVQDQDHDDQREHDQQAALDELHVGSGSHAGSCHYQDDHSSDHHYAHPVRQSQQRRNQGAGADHLRDQVKNGDHQGADGGGQLDGPGIELGIQGIGKGILAEPLQGLRHQEKCHNPSGQVTD